ncbi:MAG: hypothetical protein AAF214_08095, partial [Pseudomonadota bacterium]
MRAMRAVWFSGMALSVLAGCGDPLAGIERVSETAPVAPVDASAALPSPDELEREGGILSGLFRKRALDTAVVDASIDSPEAEGGSETTASDVNEVVDADGSENPIPATVGDAVVVPATVKSAESVETPVAAAAPAAKRGGVLGWLRRAATAETGASDASITADGTDNALQEDEAILASLEVEDIAAPEPVAAPSEDKPIAPKRAVKRSGPDARDVAVGTVLPFGEVARVCDARGRQLGSFVDEAARKGRGYKLFDTVPDGSAPRTFYVTGFADNCPRQFTAALALFGTPEFHEQLRYGLPAKEYPYSTTDKAYEKVKS